MLCPAQICVTSPDLLAVGGVLARLQDVAPSGYRPLSDPLVWSNLTLLLPVAIYVYCGAYVTGLWCVDVMCCFYFLNLCLIFFSAGWILMFRTQAAKVQVTSWSIVSSGQPLVPTRGF